MALRALLFDVDGTLADTERDGHRIAFNLAFEDAGHPWHWDETVYGELLAVTGGRERLLHFLRDKLPELAPDAPERDALARALHARKTAHYLALVASGRVALRPGMAGLIGEARAAGLILAIATTTSRANVDVLLEQALGPDARDWFACRICGEDVARKKPDPEVYQVVLDTLGLAPDECLALEDSEAGIEAAAAAGIPVLALPNDYTRDQDFDAALAVVEDPGDPRFNVDVLRALHADWCAERGREFAVADARAS